MSTAAKDSARNRWLALLGAGLFPFQLYVALAFIWIVKWDTAQPGADLERWWVESAGQQYIAYMVSVGYFVSLIVLAMSSIAQLRMRFNRAGTISIGFAIVALALGIYVGNFACRLGLDRLDYLPRIVRHVS